MFTIPLNGDGDSYQGYIKSWVFLANAYVDLGTWNCFTPYVGAGVGGAYNQLVDFVDMGIGTTGVGFGRNSANWSLAWALHAGISYDLSKSLKVDLAYRYLNYGSVTDTVDCVGGCVPDSYKFGLSVLTTSCLVCAGPAATWSSRARSTCRCTARVSHVGRSAPFG